ncbi:MAG: adenylyltransferase/cytidyltransferase family protein [bacterium]
MVGKNIVLVGGCFDIFHWGHFVFLSKAKKLGDYLVVLLESDENTKRLKGPTRPFHNQIQRRKILESLNFVDKVISLPPITKDSDYLKSILRIKPNIIAVTSGDPLFSKKRKQANLIGAKVIIIPKVKTNSTTKMAKLLKLG